MFKIIENTGICTVLYANRDPTENDNKLDFCLWISTEYLPHRMFKGKDGKWMFIGKFYPEKTVIDDA